MAPPLSLEDNPVQCIFPERGVQWAVQVQLTRRLTTSPLVPENFQNYTPSRVLRAASGAIPSFAEGTKTLTGKQSRHSPTSRFCDAFVPNTCGGTRVPSSRKMLAPAPKYAEQDPHNRWASGCCRAHGHPGLSHAWPRRLLMFGPEPTARGGHLIKVPFINGEMTKREVDHAGTRRTFAHFDL